MGNRLLAVTDDAEGTVLMGQSHSPLKRASARISPIRNAWETQPAPRSLVVRGIACPPPVTGDVDPATQLGSVGNRRLCPPFRGAVFLHRNGLVYVEFLPHLGALRPLQLDSRLTRPHQRGGAVGYSVGKQPPCRHGSGAPREPGFPLPFR